MIQQLINEFFDHLGVMDEEEGFNLKHWDKYDELSKKLVQKIPKFPGDADRESVLKVLKQLNLDNMLRKADKISPEVLYLLKEVNPPQTEYNYFDSGIATEMLQLFEGNEQWKIHWAQTGAVLRKISSYEYVPDKKKVVQLKELAQGILVDPWMNVLGNYRANQFSDIDPQRISDRDRPVKMSIIILLTGEFSQKRFHFLESYLDQTENEEDLIRFHEVLDHGDSAYLPLREQIVEKLKQLNQGAFALEVLEKAGVEPKWLENPGYLSLEITDQVYDSRSWPPTAINFSIYRDNRIEVKARINHEDVTIEPPEWEPSPEKIRSCLDNIASQLGIILDWSTLSANVNKKDKKKVESFIAGETAKAPEKTKQNAVGQAEKIMDHYLDPEQQAIGSIQEGDLIKILKKLPSGVDTQKLYDSILKLGSYSLFRYVKHLREEHLPVLKKAIDHFRNDYMHSLLMIDCLQNALETCLADQQKYPEFVETATYLNYVSSLSMTAYSASDLARADKHITKAAAENAGKTLAKYAYEDTDYIENTDTIFNGGDIIAFNLLFYALGKMNLPLVNEAVATQLKSNPKSRELYCVVSALAPNKNLEHNKKAYQAAHQALTKAEEQRVPFRLARQIGLNVQPADPWCMYITVGSGEHNYVRFCSDFIGIEIRSIWSEYLKVEISRNHSTNTYNYKEATEKLHFDPFRIRMEIERLAASQGLEELAWDKIDILTVDLDKTAKKQIKNWLGVSSQKTK